MYWEGHSTESQTSSCSWQTQPEFTSSHIIGPDGIRPSPQHIKAIAEMPNPTDVTNTRQFLGGGELPGEVCTIFVQVKFITIGREAYSTAGQQWRRMAPEHDQAAKRVKSQIWTAPVLARFNPKVQMTVHCNASKSALGAALMREGRPIAYISRALTSGEQNYAQIKKELLSVVFALETFHQYTSGRQMMVQKDHKPLLVIQRKPISKAPMRLQRMLVCLVMYDYEIVRVPGKDMHLADALTRAFLQDRREQVTFDMVNSVIVSDVNAVELQELQEAVGADDRI